MFNNFGGNFDQCIRGQPCLAVRPNFSGRFALENEWRRRWDCCRLENEEAVRRSNKSICFFGCQRPWISSNERNGYPRRTVWSTTYDIV